MKLKFTHKTWYFFLLCAAAASMLNGFAVLGGMDFSFLEMVAFCITGITILFLAAEKGSDPKDKRSYFLIFVLLMLSYVLSGWASVIKHLGISIPNICHTKTGKSPCRIATIHGCIKNHIFTHPRNNKINIIYIP